jgi:hypothetical protein
MAIKFVPKFQEYVGLSTDDKSWLLQEGAVVYYTDSRCREVYHNGVWSDFVNSGFIKNSSDKIFDGFLDLRNWDTIQTGSGDFIEVGGNTTGAGYEKISKDIFNDDTETILQSKFTVKSPARFAIALTLSQRLNGQRFVAEMVGVDNTGTVVATMPVPTAIAIQDVAQTTTTLTVNTSVAHGLYAGQRICIYGSPDSRANYTEALVASVFTPTQFSVTNTEYGAIPSQTINLIAGGFVIVVDSLNQSDNAHALVFEGTTSTLARYVARSQKSPFIESGLTTLGTTTAVVGNASGFCDSLRTACFYDMDYKVDSLVTRGFNVDSFSGQNGTLKNNQCVPDITLNYKIRIRAKNVKGMTKPIARIVSAVKSASTTATITTDVAHNLTVNDWIQLYGMRDQTNFANLSTVTQVVSIVNSTSFTIAFGASATATSYGGTVIKVNGNNTIGALGQAIQSIQRTGNLLTVTGSASWSGIAVAEAVNLHGLYDTTGVAYPQYEGAYKVASVSTTSLVLYNTGADFGLINCGGTAIKRTDFRMHCFRMLEYTRIIADIDAGNGNSSDTQNSIPVAITTAPTIGVSGTITASNTSGTAAHDAAVSGNPVRIGGRARTSNVGTVASDDTTDLITTLVGALINKPFSIPELDFYASAPSGGLLNTTTPLVIKEAPSAGLRNYYTGINVISEALGTATELELRDTDVTASSQTIASNTLTTSANHNLSIGDSIQITASTVTGLTAGTTVYVLTVPAANTLTFSATRGGGTLTISGTGVTATLHRVLWRMKISTSGLSVGDIEFPSPLRGSPATAQSIQTLTASTTGAVYFNAVGYVAP